MKYLTKQFSKRRAPYHFLLIPMLTGVAVTALSCQNASVEPASLTENMRDAYHSLHELYGYVWSPPLFMDVRSEKRIRSLLHEIATDFHRVEMDAPVEAFEPGFRVALQTHQEMLADIAVRFDEGKKEYANWRLRSVTANCIACHSRYEASVDFAGKPPPIDETSPESRLANNEFLLATRQFDAASDALYETAQTYGVNQANWLYAYRALQLWLVVEVRAKHHPVRANLLLSRFEEEARIPADKRTIFQQWKNDLSRLNGMPKNTETPLEWAKELLIPVQQNATIESDETHLVTTLQASSILHQILLASPNAETRKEATYLLAVAYYHMPLPFFDSFQDLYLELCIRDFPHTVQAKEAYGLYDTKIRADTGISGQGLLSAQQIQKLKVLRQLAYPVPSQDPNRSLSSELL